LDKQLALRYADVVLRSGLNLQPGQPLVIRTEVVQRELAEIIVRRAYGIGASFVHVVYGDRRLEVARLETSPEEHLSFVPSFHKVNYRAFVEENWASLALTGSEDPDALEGQDPRRMGAARKALAEASQEWLAAISSNALRWNVCLGPTPVWAAKVLGSPDDWEDRIWDVLKPVLRLDSPDPAAAWTAHDAELKRRAAVLNRARYDRFHFTGPGTDLWVGMAPDRVFAGGRCQARDGLQFFPNIPTEEIFSTPDFRRTEGSVRCTRPVEVFGSQVDGAWFRFSGGRVVEFGADRNRELLEQYLSTDERAGMLGEIALVGADSPIHRSGRVFHSILFDENAASHIALGNGYTECLEGARDRDADGLVEAGCNVSLVHTDFMIGSDEVSVAGVDAAGGEHPVMRDGVFVV
jgi:aminopeptidase